MVTVHHGCRTASSAAFVSLLLCFLSLLSFASVGSADVAVGPFMGIPTPSNVSFSLSISGPGNLSSYSQGRILPLTSEAGLGQPESFAKQISIKGDLVIWPNDPDYSAVLNPAVIVLQNCDSNNLTGYNATNTFEYIARRQPRTIVLYSATWRTCDYINTANPIGDVSQVFTMTRTFAPSVNGTIPGGFAQIEYAQYSRRNGSESNNTTDTSTETDTKSSNPATNSPMFVLYAVIGIISVAFLIVICTGIIRTYRHPETYGPRPPIYGRPRQTRVRGIARAVVDTIPLATFRRHGGEARAVMVAPKPAEVDDDVEMVTANQSRENISVPPRSKAASHHEPPIEQVKAITPAASRPPSPDPGEPSTSAEAAVITTPTHVIIDPTQVSCAICRDEFIEGESLRVLPCKHCFHPECVDPWLLNRSGSCPLCRIDLRPPPDLDNPDADLDLDVPLNSGDLANSMNATAYQQSRLSRYLRAARLSDNAERAAALRRLREEDRIARGGARNRSSGGVPEIGITRLRAMFRPPLGVEGSGDAPGSSQSAPTLTARTVRRRGASDLPVATSSGSTPWASAPAVVDANRASDESSGPSPERAGDAVG